jgi:hypothetical protein
MKGLHVTFALGVAMAGAATLVAAGQKWFRLKIVEEDVSHSDEKIDVKSERVLS